MKHKIESLLFFKVVLFCPILFGLVQFTGFNNLSEKPSSKKNIKSLLKKMNYMEGGTFTMGNLSDPHIIMKDSDSTLFSQGIPKRTKVDPFYISATEITNGEWREFYQDRVNVLGESVCKQNYFPDTSMWIKEFPYSYNKPMADNYYSHPKFYNYPVVGISWDQANEYCKWKTNKLKELLEKKGIQSNVKFRLPTEIEWEYAALKKVNEFINIKEMAYSWSEKNSLSQINKLANIGQIHDNNNVLIKSYVADGCMYTCQIANYPPNDKGMYDMAGNVSEWTSDQAYTMSYDFDNNEVIRLERLADIEKEIEKLQNKYDTGNQDVEIYLKWLKHDRKVLKSDNIKICKGGNWANGLIYTQTGSRQGVHKDSPSTKIGFRIAITVTDKKVIKYFPKKKWKP